jgi:hypothetical protein
VLIHLEPADRARPGAEWMRPVGDGPVGDGGERTPTAG